MHNWCLHPQCLFETTEYSDQSALVQHFTAAHAGNPAEAGVATKVCAFTYYTTDYAPGYLCSKVNEQWAAIHGYDWVERVIEPDEALRAIDPRKHCGWCKVQLINELIASGEYTHIIWIDADACVTDQSRTVEEICAGAGWRDLTIGEDLTPTCLVNSGVMIIACTLWSAELWHTVWEEPFYQRWYSSPVFEQTALCHYLKKYEDGFGSAEPWFSYSGGHGVRLTTHVAVLDSCDINTNLGSHQFQKQKRQHKHDRLLSTSDSSDVTNRPRFIFHAVGCSPKIAAISSALSNGGVPVPDVPVHLLQLAVRNGGNRTNGGDQGLLTAAEALSASPFSYLDLDGCDLTDAAVPTINLIISHNLKLETLRLCANGFTAAGLSVLTQVVAKCTNLRVLHLCRLRQLASSERTVVASAVAALMAVSHLRLIDLSGCHLKTHPEVMQAIELALVSRGAQLPLNWLPAPGAKLCMHHGGDAHTITLAHLGATIYV